MADGIPRRKPEVTPQSEGAHELMQQDDAEPAEALEEASAPKINGGQPLFLSSSMCFASCISAYSKGGHSFIFSRWFATAKVHSELILFFSLYSCLVINICLKPVRHGCAAPEASREAAALKVSSHSHALFLVSWCLCHAVRILVFNICEIIVHLPRLLRNHSTGLWSASTHF